MRRNEGSNGTIQHDAGDDDDDDDDDESIDVEVESFEEYEWAGQTRIRASSLLEGGYSAAGLFFFKFIFLQKSHHCVLGVGTAIQNAGHADDEEDLNVDVIEPYGQPQYTEHDVIDPTTVSKKKRTLNLYLRTLIAGGQDGSSSSFSSNNNNPVGRGEDDKIEDVMMTEPAPTAAANGVVGSADEVALLSLSSSSSLSSTTASSSSTAIVALPSTSNGCSSSSTVVDLTHESKNKIIDALKMRIREFEQQRSQKLKCLICIDEYRVPVVSICCWHVHCEECWLRTLGARKLCPQCNMITSPTDLRRIYM